MTPPNPLPSVEDAAVDLIRSRGIVGRAKYGQPMDRRDLSLSQWARHHQEELADGIQYAERVRRGGELLESARAIMISLRDERGWECAGDWIASHDAQFGANLP